VPTIAEDKEEEKRVFNILSGQSITDRDPRRHLQISFSPVILTPPVGVPVGLNTTAEKDGIVYSATKEQIEQIEAFIKKAPVTTSYLAELFELTPESKSEYLLRSDVVTRPVVSANTAAMNYDNLEEALYNRLRKDGRILHPQIDGQIYVQRVVGRDLIDALIVIRVPKDGEYITAYAKRRTSPSTKRKSFSTFEYGPPRSAAAATVRLLKASRP